jgi:hypothetical protein
VLQTASQSDAPPIGAFSMASDEAVTVSLDEQTIKTSRPFRRTTPAVELAWNVVKESKDVSVVRRFTDHFPSARRRAEVVARMDQFFFTAPDGARATIGSARPLTTRDVMLQAAQDEDVLRCFQLNDIYAPQCRNALERYPLIARYTYDYRFRFTLCQALGDACSGRRDMLASGANLQSNALFNPQNTDVTRLSAVPAGPGSSGASSATATPNTSSAGSTATPAPRIVPSPTPPAPPTPTPTPTVKHYYRSVTHSHTDKTVHGVRSFRIGVKSNAILSARSTVRSGAISGGSSVSAHRHAIKLPSTPTVKISTVTPTVKISTVTPTIKVPTTASVKVPTIVTPTLRTPIVRTPVIKTPTISVRVPTVRIPH